MCCMLVLSLIEALNSYYHHHHRYSYKLLLPLGYRCGNLLKNSTVTAEGAGIPI